MNLRFSNTGLRVCLAFCMAMVAKTSLAETRVEIQGGSSYMDSASTETVFVEGVLAEHAIGSTRVSWAPDISLGWINGRRSPHYETAKYTTKDAIWLIAGGARFRYGGEDDWYHSLFFSFQPALHTGKTQALSSVYEFVSTIGWQGRRFSVQLRHISNGSLHKPNRGETMALIGVRLDF